MDLFQDSKAATLLLEFGEAKMKITECYVRAKSNYMKLSQKKSNTFVSWPIRKSIIHPPLSLYSVVSKQLFCFPVKMLLKNPRTYVPLNQNCVFLPTVFKELNLEETDLLGLEYVCSVV